ALLRALHAHNKILIHPRELAEQACHIELDILKEPIGKQDQYIAAFGGMKNLEFGTDGSVVVTPLAIATETMHDLEDHLLLFFTGYARDAGTILSDQSRRSEANDQAMLDGLHLTRRIGTEVRAALERGDARSFGGLMHEHWQQKRKRSHGMSDDRIDAWYELALENGAVGGKLVGAGGGGFLLFYAEEPARLRHAMAEAGLPEMRFGFDHEGTSVIVRS
ncbi:MAG: galactokinase, partial [Candidatus Dormiibacterota bacterium]